jgi:hypothetical protein
MTHQRRFGSRESSGVGAVAGSVREIPELGDLACCPGPRGLAPGGAGWHSLELHEGRGFRPLEGVENPVSAGALPLPASALVQLQRPIEGRPCLS